MNASIVAIVEGHGEVRAVPELLRRVFSELEVFDVCAARPYRVRRNKVVKQGELERHLARATQDRENVRAILLLLDAERDCPVKLGQELLERCRSTTQLPIAVVVAQKEFEAWFLGAKESLRGVRGISQDAVAPADPESIQGAKERLSANMGGRRYVEVDDQPALAAKMDFEQARRLCPSFDKFLRDVKRLVAQIHGLSSSDNT